MKIGVVAPAASPYARGGFERLWSGFVNHVNDATRHQAELIKLPFPERDLHQVIDGYRRFAELDVSGFDLVVTSKYPGWMIDHPNHIVYLAHTLRGLYDTYPSDFPLTVDEPDAQELLVWLESVRHAGDQDAVFAVYDEARRRFPIDHPIFGHPGPFGRLLVTALDGIGLSRHRVREHLAIARTVADRPGYFPPNVPVGVIHPPTDLQVTPQEAAGGYFFTASRLDAPKRLDLLVTAWRHTDIDARLLIAGSGPDRDRLVDLAAGDDRIELLGFVPDEDLPALYAGAIAVPFLPYDEDYGLIALEALASGTPVLTCHDSGGPTELVRDGKTGRIVAPEVGALAQALTEFAGDPVAARVMGHRGRDSVTDVTWDRLVRRLVGSAGRSGGMAVPEQARTGAPLLLDVNTFVAHDHGGGGGTLRARHLAAGLTSKFDVHMLSLADVASPGGTISPRRGLCETAIPRTPHHADLENRMAAQIGQVVSDLYGGIGIGRTAEYVREYRRLSAQSAAILLSHPYLVPVVEHGVGGRPVVYDAYNVEVRLKDGMYPRTPAGDRAIEEVRRLESEAIAMADLVALCSAEDEAMMRSVYGELPRSIVIPNGTDVDTIPLTVGEDRIERRRRWLDKAGRRPTDRLALYLASWHQPNLEAAETLHELAADRPDVVFVMVGSHCDYFAGRKLPSNVLQLGRIGDLTKRVLLQCCDVGVNPMASGSGTNLKLVEYLAAGMVALSTPFGARGLPDDGGGTIVVELEEFGDGLDRVLAQDHDAPGRVDTARRARQLVEDGFSWPALGRRFADKILEVVAARAQA